jgi:hypothetical protein
MPQFDVTGGVGRLQRAQAKLREKWLEAHSYWNDQASRDFETAYLQPLPARITLTVAAVYELADLLEKAIRDLEDRQS